MQMTSTSQRPTASNEENILPLKGLLVREPWITLLVEGRKTWELRGSRTTHRGRTGLIAAGAGVVVGEARLIDVVGPLGPEELEAAESFHRVGKSMYADRLPYAQTFAWVFEDAFRYKEPFSYTHPQGAVIWVRLPASQVACP